MNKKKIAYFLTTGLLSLMLGIGGVNQALGGPDVTAQFAHFGITNSALITFLGVLKVLGAVGLWVRPGQNWAYKGSAFLFAGAIVTHIGVGDPIEALIPAVVAMVFWEISYALNASLNKGAI